MSQLFEFEITTNDEDFITKIIEENNSSLISSEKAIVDIDINSKDTPTKYVCISTPDIETANNITNKLNEQYKTKAIRFSDKSWDIAISEEIEKYKDFENDKVVTFNCPNKNTQNLTLLYNEINRSIEKANIDFLTVISKDSSNGFISIATPLVKNNDINDKQPSNNINIDNLINNLNIQDKYNCQVKILDNSNLYPGLDMDNIEFTANSGIVTPNAISILNITKEIDIDKVKDLICEEIEQNHQKEIDMEIKR